MNFHYIFYVFMLSFGMSVLSAQENYKTLIYKGNQQFDKKNYEGSSSRYMEAVKINGKDFTAHYNLGNALYKRKMYAEAKAEFEKAEKLATTLPDKSAALYNLGNTYMQDGNSEKAAEFYKNALKQDPYNETIRKNYEIAKLKEKEKQQQKQQQDGDNGGEGNQQDNQDQKKGQEKGNQPQQQNGNGQQDKGEGDGKDPNKNNGANSSQMPKELEDAILNRVGNRERETAKRILNKNSYAMPESNEKDW